MMSLNNLQKSDDQNQRNKSIKMEPTENNQKYPLEIYENLPCQSEDKLNDKSNNGLDANKMLLKEGLYATPLRKSDRPKSGRPPNPRLIEKDVKEDENNAEASKEDVNQDLEEKRIRSFLKDTSQMHKRLELQKDLQNTNFSYLARKEHFANLVQQNIIVNDETGEEKTVEKQDTELIGIEKEMNLKERDGLRLVGSVQSSPTFRPSRHFEMIDLNREWVLKKIAMCLEQRSTKKPIPVLPGVESIDGNKGSSGNSNLPQLGYLILGSNGSGKTTICQDIQNGVTGTKGLLNRRLLACYFVNSQDAECHSLSSFIRSFVLQILSHSNYLVKEENGNGSTASDPDNPENLPEADQNRDAARQRNESESSVLDRELEELIKEELQQQERDNKIRRQRSEQTDEKTTESPNFYGTHPPLQKQVQELKDSKSQQPSPSKKSKIPVAIGKSPPKTDLAPTVPGNNNTGNEDTKLPEDGEKQDKPDTEKVDQKDNSTEKDEVIIAEDAGEATANANDITLEADTIEDEVTPPPPPPPTKLKAVLTAIADAYFEMLVTCPEIMDSLTIENIEKNPDDCFKKAILFPLLEMSPPKTAQLLLIDSIDENYLNEGSLISTMKGKVAAKSRTIAELLSNHIHLFPKWLFLVCTAKKQNKNITKMFTGKK